MLPRAHHKRPVVWTRGLARASLRIPARGHL